MFYEKPLFTAGVSAGDIDKCMAWAFGNDWRAAARSSLKDLWNNLHKDLLVIVSANDVYETLIKVGMLYLEHEGKPPIDPEVFTTEKLIEILEARMQAEVMFIRGSARAKFRRT
jgi:hypothetical protein